MKSIQWNARFWASTRGQIILLLRRGSRTVNELAEALRLTDNAVRTHLTTLERDGLVHASGTRPGPRKPQVTYDLTSEADQLFPRVYGPILHHLLDVLKERMPSEELEGAMRAVGHRLAAVYRPDVQAGTLRDRAEQAITVLGALGDLAELREDDGKLVICSFDCPLTVAVAGHPEVCRLVETFLADIIGVPVRQRCRREPTPKCYFEVGGAAAMRPVGG
jgi:predicted ArsR family transcriptional regulator